ncbi:MAG: hypothetical protein ACI4J1_00340 [Ruminiclostridium sp.]
MCDTFEQEYKFSLFFGGEEGMPLQALGNQLINFNALLNIAIGNEYKCDMKVVAAKEGSLEVEIASLATLAVTFLTPENIQYVKTTLDTIKEWFGIMLHLKGEKPQSVESTGDEVIIKNNQGYVFNASIKGSEILKNNTIQNLIVNIGSQLNENKRNSFRIKDDNGEIFSIETDGIEQISNPIPNLHETKIIHVETKTTVQVVKPVLKGKSKWDFYTNKTISASIEDEEWLERFQNGEITLFAGIQFEVLLHTEYQVDQYGSPVLNSEKYSIKRIIRILDRENEQIEF